MPLLQSADVRDVAVPKPLRIDKSARSASSTSPSPSPAVQQQNDRLELSTSLRARATPSARTSPVPDCQGVEVPKRLRIDNQSARSAPLSSPSPSPQQQQQPHRLELSIPIRSRLTPPPKVLPVHSTQWKSDQKTSRIPVLRINRKSTHHTTKEPATPSLPLGNSVSITTGSTPSPITPSSSLSPSTPSTPTSPFPLDKKTSTPTTTTTSLPAPLTQTPASPLTSTPTPPSKQRRTNLAATWTRLKRPLTVLSMWTKRRETAAEAELRKLSQAAEAWRRYTTAMTTHSVFGVDFEVSARMALGEVLERNAYAGGRVETPVGKRRRRMERGGEMEDEVVRTRALLVERLALLNLEVNRMSGLKR